jgi:hypothetical protein
MICKYYRVDEKENKWVLTPKSLKDLNSIDKLAVDAVVHDLNNNKNQEVDGANTTLEDDIDLTYWSGNYCQIDSDRFTVYIDEELYVLRYLYIARDKVVLVTSHVKNYDVLSSLSDDALDKLKELYFIVEY